MHNPYEQFRRLLPAAPLQVGTVIEVGVGVVSIQLPGGGIIQARGTAAIGQPVFVRDNVVEASAPSLPIELIEV